MRGCHRFTGLLLIQGDTQRVNHFRRCWTRLNGLRQFPEHGTHTLRRGHDGVHQLRRQMHFGIPEFIEQIFSQMTEGHEFCGIQEPGFLDRVETPENIVQQAILGIFFQIDKLVTTSESRSLASCRKSCRRSSIPEKSLMLNLLESQAIEQIVNLLLTYHDIGTPTGIDHRSIERQVTDSVRFFSRMVSIRIPINYGQDLEPAPTTFLMTWPVRS